MEQLSSFKEVYNVIGTTGFLLFILWQLLQKYVFKGTLDDRLHTLETNHIVHLEQDINQIKTDLKDVKKEQELQGNRITRVETKINL